MIDLDIFISISQRQIKSNLFTSDSQLFIRILIQQMVRYAYNSTLPCNPTLDQGIRLQDQYKLINQVGMVSEAKLQTIIKNFFNNHLTQIIQAYSLISKGSISKIFSVENKRNKALFSQRKTNLDTLSSYFNDNESMLEALENDLNRNFKNEMMEMFQKIKTSIQTTINMYKNLVQKEISKIKINIRQNIERVKEQMKRLRQEQNEKLILNEDRKLSHNEISKIMSISCEQVKGYETIFKIVGNNVPIMRKLSSLQERLDQNDQFPSCQHEIKRLKIFCDRSTCGQMWYAIELLKKKGVYMQSPPSHENSFSSQNNSFTSYQGPTQNLFTFIDRDNFTQQPNPQMQFNHIQLINNYENYLRQVEKKIVNKFYNLFYCYNTNQNIYQGEQNTRQNKSQPLSNFLTQNLLYRIYLESKQIVQCEFQKISEKNKSSNFIFTNQKEYYEVLNSSSQNQQMSDNQQQNQQQVLQHQVQQNHMDISFAKQIIIDSSTTDQQEKSFDKKYLNSNHQSIQRQNQQAYREWFQKSISKDQNGFSFQSSREQSKNNNQITRQFKQDLIQKPQSQDDKSVHQQDDQSILHSASDSDNDDDGDDDQNQQHQSIHNNNSTQNQHQKNQQEQEENKKSSKKQYEEYIQMRKKKYMIQQQQEQQFNYNLTKQQLQRQKMIKQEQKIFNAHQRKLNYEENHGQKYRQDLKNNNDVIEDFDMTNIDEQQIDRILYHKKREENQKQFETQSMIKKDPERNKILEGWENCRQMEKYNYFPKDKQNQDLIQYVSYDYEPENQRQKSFEGIVPVREQFLYDPVHYQQKMLPEEISQYLGEDIEEQRKIMQQFEKKATKPKEDSRFMKKVGEVIKDIIIPGFHAIKMQKNIKRNQDILIKKEQQVKASQDFLMQEAIRLSLQESSNKKMNNRNEDFDNLGFDEISIIQPNNLRGPGRYPNPLHPNMIQKSQFQQQDQQLDFTIFDDLFKQLSSLKATFSLYQNFNTQLFGDEYQDRPIFRGRKNQIITTIQTIRYRQDELSDSKEEFSIFVKVLKPILLTFKTLDKSKNRPMSKFIVGDKTGIAVLYMNYYLQVKPGTCLKLQKCRVCKYRGSYQITNMSRLQMHNIQPGQNIPTVNQLNTLSLIRKFSGILSYQVRPHYNQLLRDCVRDFFKNKNYQEVIKKPLILTVCRATQRDRRYVFGDYTGRILAQLVNCQRVQLSPNDTVLIRNIRICQRGDTLLLVGQRRTSILKADSNWRFSHDMNFIPDELFVTK